MALIISRQKENIIQTDTLIDFVVRKVYYIGGAIICVESELA